MRLANYAVKLRFSSYKILPSPLQLKRRIGQFPAIPHHSQVVLGPGYNLGSPEQLSKVPVPDRGPDQGEISQTLAVEPKHWYFFEGPQVILIGH